MNQVVCDFCGEPIKLSEPYFTGSIQKVQLSPDGGATAVGETRQFDLHVEHIPEGFNPETPPPVTEPEPQPEPEPSPDG